jgi:glycosyltransferase involved in cell wall biosynthesis
MDIPEIRSLRRTIDNLNLQESIFLPGYVDDRDLPSFYSACDLFVFPSLYEGFGLPVLEAMACAAPVLASNKSSIPEVGGQSIEYFLAEEIESLVESCANLLQDSKRLDEMRSKGPQRASKFSWKDNAISLTRLYKSLVQ